MQRQYIPIFLLFLTSAFATIEEFDIEQPSFIDSSKAISNEPRLIINNRPLAKINGKVISLYDVVKKMDLFLYSYYPNHAFSPVEKYQYYVERWMAALDDMIFDELVLLDAESKEIKVSDGEVRETLEERFGPSIMLNLDKVNLEYEEARTMIRNDLIIQQLIGMKVHAKAFQTITPQVIKSAYDDYLVKNPPEDEWKYQVLTIRGKDKEICETLANKAYTLLQEKGKTLDQVCQEIETTKASVKLSEDYLEPTQKISKQHLEVIEALESDAYSSPIKQVSRFDNSDVYRIFHLKDRIKKLPQTFDQINNKLKNDLLFEDSDKEKQTYLDKLKKRFGYENHDPKFVLPEDYRPFVIL